MPVNIIRQYNKQNGNQTVDTTGGGSGLAVIACHSAYNANVAQDTFNGSGPTGNQTYTSDNPAGTVRTRNRISWWLSPSVGSYTWTMNDTYEGTIFVIDGVISVNPYSHSCVAYEGQGVLHQQNDSTSNPTGLMIGIATAGNNYSNTGGNTIDYDISWNTPQQTHWHKACTSTLWQAEYTISNDNRTGGWGVLFIRGAVGRIFDIPNPIVGLYEKMKRRTKLYQELLAKGAIPLGNQELLPI